MFKFVDKYPPLFGSLKCVSNKDGTLQTQGPITHISFGALLSGIPPLTRLSPWIRYMLQTLRGAFVLNVRGV